MLLYTRNRILEQEFLVDRCDDVSCLPEKLSQGPLDLLLLCQSVPDAECVEVIKMVRGIARGEGARHAGGPFRIMFSAFRCVDGKLGRAFRPVARDPCTTGNRFPSGRSSGISRSPIVLLSTDELGQRSGERAVRVHDSANDLATETPYHF
jgi:hypothetical protein